jgi:hypothetical protein
MPGDNCAVIGCGTCWRTKGISIFKLPAPKNKEYTAWRSQWLKELTKTSVIDKNFRVQIDNSKVFTCEKHFKEEYIETCKCQVLNNSGIQDLVVLNKNNTLKLTTIYILTVESHITKYKIYELMLQWLLLNIVTCQQTF